jgi:LPXTG-motif cell wall-anchored protein
LTALIAPVSAVPIGDHDITFVGPHDYDPTTCISTWTYIVTAGSKDISHWVLAWCNESAIEDTSEAFVYGYDPETEITGIKFETDHGGGVVLAGTSRTFWIQLRGCGDYYEKLRDVTTKTGTRVDKGEVTGPKGFDATPCAPVPELPTIILLGAGLLTLAGYVGLRRKKK